MLSSDRSTPPEPDRQPALQVADDDAIDVPLPNGDLVDADYRGSRLARARELLLHVELVHLLDRVPVEAQVVRHLLDRGTAALLAHVQRKALGVVRIGREPVEPFPLHATAPAAVDAPDLDVEVDPQVAARQIAHAANFPVVPRAVRAPTRPTDRFFGRRLRARTRALGSPKRPTTVRLGVKPGKRYASRSSRRGTRREVIPELQVLVTHPASLRFPLTATASPQ